MTFRIDAPVRDESGDMDDEKLVNFNRELLDRFGESPEYRELEFQTGWTESVLDYAAGYFDESVSEISRDSFHEILFELFPRKVSCETGAADEIVTELRAFWTWIAREFQLPQASECLEVLDDDAVDILRGELSDPSNFGMAKSFIMMGREAGFDMTTQESLNAFMLAYNTSMIAGRPSSEDNSPHWTGNVPAPDDHDTPAPHSVRQRERMARKQKKQKRQERRKQNKANRRRKR